MDTSEVETSVADKVVTEAPVADTENNANETVEAPPEEGVATASEPEKITNRVQVKNIPKFMGHKDFRRLLDKTLGTESIGKIRQMRDTAYVNLNSSEKAQEAIEKFNGMILKKFTLECIMAEEAPQRGRNLPESAETARIKSARESVTPLADMPYDDQIKMKTRECHKLVRRMLNDFYSARVEGIKGVNSHALLNPIVPFTSTAVYRNKCEFTVGKSLEGKTTVGFVGGRFSKNEHYILPVDDCPNLSPQTVAIVNEFAKFVDESGLEPFNEFKREGVWKMLTVRELSGDILMIVTIFPLEDKEKEIEMKKKLIERFDSLDTISHEFRVTSLYWQTQANASDEPIREHISGSPYIYETVLGVRFRVSPDAFFQTNSAAAAILYKTIGNVCQLGTDEKISVKEDKDEVKEEEEVPEKRMKIEENEVEEKKNDEVIEKKEDEVMANNEDNKEEKTILLDICCGTGTIGQVIMKNIGDQRAKNTYCIGIEMIESAVEDAKANARDNGISDKLCSYIAGKAEDTFRSLKRFIPQDFSLDSSRVIGILDPPRRGIHHKVVVGCRELSSLQRLIFVSCDPSAAIKNLTDLCRPTSNKFSGSPFKIEKITPVDMFPMTEHFEWIISLIRQ